MNPCHCRLRWCSSRPHVLLTEASLNDFLECFLLKLENAHRHVLLVSTQWFKLKWERGGEWVCVWRHACWHVRSWCSRCWELVIWREALSELAGGAEGSSNTRGPCCRLIWGSHRTPTRVKRALHTSPFLPALQQTAAFTQSSHFIQEMARSTPWVQAWISYKAYSLSALTWFCSSGSPAGCTFIYSLTNNRAFTILGELL